MNNLIKTFLMMGLCDATGFGPVSAATIQLNASTFPGQVGFGDDGNMVPVVGVDEVIDYTEASPGTTEIKAGSWAVGSWGEGSADALASVDAETGEMKLKLEAWRKGSLNGSPESGAWAYVEIFETFTLFGTGTFTATSLVDVIWDSPAFSFFSDVTLSGAFIGSGVSDMFYADSASDPSSGSALGKSLSVSVTLNDAAGQVLTVIWRLFGDVSAPSTALATSSMLDASHTTTIGFETTGTLIATPSSSLFLSKAQGGSGGVSPVPVPSAGLMLCGALTGIFALRIRRKESA